MTKILPCHYVSPKNHGSSEKLELEGTLALSTCLHFEPSYGSPDTVGRSSAELPNLDFLFSKAFIND